MGPVFDLVLAGAGVVFTVGAVAIWLAIKRPALSRQRRQRDDALAAAGHYTPAARQPVYGQAVQPDPCAPGLSDQERVVAMRALLMRGDAHDVACASGDGFAATQPCADDEVTTTAPLAWKHTQPVDMNRVEPDRTSAAAAKRRQHDMVPLT